MGFHTGTLLADDNAYKKAIERRSEILSQMQTLQAALGDVEEFITLYERLFVGSAAAGSESFEGSDEQGRQRRPRNVLSPTRIADICREIIMQTRRPMTRTELLDALKARGIPLVGSDPSKNLGTILWRSRDRFEQIRGQGYWIKGQPLPE